MNFLRTNHIWGLLIVLVTTVSTTIVVNTLTGAAEEQRTYVGVEECEMCHGDIADSWRKTAHGRAFYPLESMGVTKADKCLPCHTTGYGNGGFESLDKTPNLKNVQCEACHGPGSLHIDDPGPENINRVFPATVCAKCHMKVNIHPED